MLSSSQKSHLKTMANRLLYPTIKIVRNDINEEVSQQIEHRLRRKELVKIIFFDSSEKNIKDITNTIMKNTNAELVEIRGHKVILYRASRSNIIKFNNI